MVGLLEGDLDDGEAPLEADPADESFEITQPAVSRPSRRGGRPSDGAAGAAAAPQTDRPRPPRARPPRRCAAHRHARRSATSLELADEAMARVAPALREQLHETLEKIAWEAFGRAAENIVEQAVERLEKAAWEVVPRLARR